jgi:hypothetical protein
MDNHVLTSRTVPERIRTKKIVMSGVLIISFDTKLGHYPDFFSYNTKFDPNPRRGFAILRYAHTDVQFFVRHFLSALHMGHRRDKNE